MIINSEPETETLEVTDIDISFGLGGMLNLTLFPGDDWCGDKPLATGDIVVTYASGEVSRINGSLVQWVSRRKRTITRLVKKEQKA